MPQLKLTSQNLAVIGAGAAGLVAARELLREGHTVVVFEREARLGGTWVYTSDVESDPLGLDPNREVVHSSLYRSLRTNLPREVMGFSDFPFVATGNHSRDSRRYPSHEEVLRYLEDFACKFKLSELVRYDTEVTSVVIEDGKVNVRSRRRGNGSEVDETFDAIVVCNGHHTEPRIAEIHGIKEWPGMQIHSHNYRVPEPYKNLVVVIIGSSYSAEDISMELATVAKEIHVASRSTSGEAFRNKPHYDNIWLHPMIASAKSDGTLIFEDGVTVRANVIVHCTGYRYHFPFLHSKDVVDVVAVDDNRVGPLYKHVFPPSLAPCLSFIGLPWKCWIFPLFELQSKWVAGILSGRIALLSAREMMEDVEAFYSRLDNAGVPKRHTHRLGQLQFEYYDWLVSQIGCAPPEEWRKQMYLNTLKMKQNQPNAFRDEWDDDTLILEAHKDFLRYLNCDSRSAPMEEKVINLSEIY